MKYKVIQISLFVFIILIGCSSKKSNTPSDKIQSPVSAKIPEHILKLDSLNVFSADSKPMSAIRFEEEQQFGEIYPALLPPTRGFGPETAVDQNGQVFRADKEQKTIHVYNPDGSKLTDIGREGRGPREFVVLSAIQIHNNRLIVYDSNLARISIFSLDPVELYKSIKIDMQSWGTLDGVKNPFPATIISLDDTTFLTAVRLEERDGYPWFGYYRMDEASTITSDRIIEQQQIKMHQGKGKHGLATIRLPFSNKGLLWVAKEGTLYHANTKEFLIKMYDSEGEYQRAIYYPYKKDALEDQEVLDQVHPNLHNVVKSAEFPETWPAMESMLVDDESRIWVSTIINDKTVYEWWVLSNSGKLLAKFNWPRNEPIVAVKNEKIYVERKDEENGAKIVVSYTLHLK